jgi:hypothetical protein
VRCAATAGGVAGHVIVTAPLPSGKTRLKKVTAAVPEPAWASYLQSSYGYAKTRMEQIEALVTSDPTKLADAAAMVRDGSWDLEQSLGVNVEHQAYEVVAFQQRMSALQYMLPRLISAASEPCDVGGSADDPTTYEAWTQLYDAQAGAFIDPQRNRLRSAHLTATDAQTLASRLFDAPFGADSDPLAVGPSSAALPRSPFFMWQIAPTTSSTASACADYLP